MKMDEMNDWDNLAGVVRSDEPRRETAAPLRSYLPWLRREGLFENVRLAVSPAAAALMAAPPLPTSWIQSSLMYEIFEAVSALRGDEGMVEMCLVGTRESLGIVARPIWGMFLKLFGASPSSLFSHMPALTTLFIRGLVFDWTPLTENSGSLLLAYAGPTPLPVFHGWRGTSSFAFEVCKTSGSIEMEISPDRSAARYTITWAVS
jgi:hypothetical protein